MSSSNLEGPRTFTITPADHGGTIVVVSTLLMTWSILCLAIRIYNRTTLSSSLGLDDLICGISTVLAVIQTLVGCVAVTNGFGKSPTVFPHVSLVQNEQYEYAVEIICMLVVGLSKACMLLFHLRITPHRGQRVACYALIGISALWTLAAMIVVGFRCGSDSSYLLEDDRCSSFTRSWIGLAISDCLLEAMIFVVPVWILWDIQTTVSYKATILLSFATRLLIIAASAVHVSTTSTWANAGFTSVGAVTPTIWLQIEANYAIMSTTFPTLGTLIKSLNTRWGALDGPEVAEYALQSLSRTPSASRRRTMKATPTVATNGEPRLRPDTTNYSFRIRPQVSDPVVRSSEDSDQMIIRKTISTSVEHQATQTSATSI